METSTGKTALKAAYPCASAAFSFWRYRCLSCLYLFCLVQLLDKIWHSRTYSIRKKVLWDLLFECNKKKVGILLPNLVTLEIHFHFIRKIGKSFKKNFNLKMMSKTHQLVQENIKRAPPKQESWMWVLLKYGKVFCEATAKWQIKQTITFLHKHIHTLL